MYDLYYFLQKVLFLWFSWWNISKHLHMLCFWLQSLSVWLQATSKIHSGQVFFLGCDTIWQFGEINRGSTTSHCFKWYWSKFTLILLIKAKNNTEQIHDLKELDEGFWSCNSLLILQFQICGCCCCLHVGCPAEMCSWSTTLSRPEEWGASSKPADECTRGGRSLWFGVNTHRCWPLPCHVPPRSRYDKWLYRSKHPFITALTEIKTERETK